MDQFTKAYIEAALWSTNDDDGDPLDDNYSQFDIDADTLAAMVADCKRFQGENADDIATYLHDDYSPEEMAGYDFFLTRNGHGCGFWETPDWPEESGDRLTKASEAFGEFNLYVEDGKIYS